MGLHRKTPTLTVNDPRGLAARTVGYWRCAEALPIESRIERTFFDAAGRAVKQWDARLWSLQLSDPQTPANVQRVQSLSGRAVRTDSVDAGRQIELVGPGDEVLFAWDSRQLRREIEHDPLLRPVAIFEQSTAQPRLCTQRFNYGMPGTGDQALNQFGQLIRHDDPAGSALFDAFSITGHRIATTRHFTLDPVMPDWPEPIIERQRLLEPGPGALSRCRFGALGDVLELVDARGNVQAFDTTLDGRLRACRLTLQSSAQPVLTGNFRYNAEGGIEQHIAGNGVQTDLVYRREDGVLIHRRAVDAAGKVLQNLVYDYDPMGNVVSIEDKVQPIRYFANQRIEPISRFVYDTLYQLSEATGWEAGGPWQGPQSISRADPAAISNYRQTYHYDAGGNLLELTHVGAQDHGRRLKAARYSNRCLAYRNDAPPTEEAIAAAFDARGNLLELDQGRRVHWNLLNQLQSISPVERTGGVDDQEIYVYDGNGQRVRKRRSLQTRARTVLSDVRYLPGLELRTDSGTGEILQVITFEDGLNSLRVLHWETAPPSGTNDHFRYQQTDHLGSVCLELAADARIISQEVFYPFGETASVVGDRGEVSYKTVRYSGKERDATGLFDFGYRLYIPWLQRWLNPDPLGNVEGHNLYRMLLNNPITYSDADGAVSRKRLPNGLWEPVIAAGAERDIAGASRVNTGQPALGLAAAGTPTSLSKALKPPELGRVEVSTAFINPAQGRYSQAVTQRLHNKAGGAEFIFTMDKVTYAGVIKGEFNALRIVDIAAGEIPDKDNAVAGYWAPQGGYVDIALHPSGVMPDHVFTPAFSGCSLTVAQLNENVLRVRHVEGGKENAQFNGLPDSEHGMGLGAAMEYADYGYAPDAQGHPEEIITGFAFMKYDRGQHAWNIHYQTTQGASGIERYQPGKSGFFSRSNATVTAYPGTRVRKTMTKRVVTAHG